MTAYAPRPKVYTLLALLLLTTAAGHARAADWYEWRGPARDGVSHERGATIKIATHGRSPIIADTTNVGDTAQLTVLPDSLSIVGAAA